MRVAHFDYAQCDTSAYLTILYNLRYTLWQSIAIFAAKLPYMPPLNTLLGQLRIVAFLEGVSLLLLFFIAMPLKYMADMPAMVSVVGMAHGLLFVAYVIYVILAKMEFKWSIGKTALALFLSLVPFGTFWADAKLFR